MDWLYAGSPDRTSRRVDPRDHGLPLSERSRYISDVPRSFAWPSFFQNSIMSRVSSLTLSRVLRDINHVRLIDPTNTTEYRYSGRDSMDEPKIYEFLDVFVRRAVKVLLYEKAVLLPTFQTELSDLLEFSIKAGFALLRVALKFFALRRLVVSCSLVDRRAWGLHRTSCSGACTRSRKRDR
jgi:hypothetical protein